MKLGRDSEAREVGASRREPVAEDRLGGAVGIRGRGVEERDPAFKSVVEQLMRRLLIHLTAEGDAAQSNFARSIFHR